MIWNPEIETMPRAKIVQLQSERLSKLTNYLYQRVPMYQQRLKMANIKPEQIKSIHDLPKLPFTNKSDLRDNYPFGLFATPMNEVVRVHASSGTTGKPTVVGYSQHDIEIWAEVCARCFGLSGAKPGDMFQNAYGYGLFTGGLGMHYGAEKFGCTVIPISGGNTARQMLLLQDFKTAVMACTPSYALTLADEILRSGIAPSTLAIHTFILGAEPWTQEMRVELETKLGANAVNIYGLSEVIGPGVSNECVEAKDGMHIAEDHFLTEVLDPLTGLPVAEGVVGEITFTTLTKTAMPVLRYRTGDLCSITHEKCKCGRTHARMSRILGRTDDMLIIRGINVFPSQIEAALVGKQHLTPHYLLVVSRDGHLDSMDVQIEVSDSYYLALGQSRFNDPDDSAKQHLRAIARKLLHDALGLNVEVTLLEPGKAPRSEGGKLKRVIDKRTN
jgi:phenylacetate-CoA ligase